MIPGTMLDAIARRFAAEDAVVTANVAGGLVLGVLALGGGSAPRVLVQRCHVVRLGAPVTRLLELIQARSVEIGAVDGCEVEEFAGALPDCDLALYVVDEAVPPGGLDLPGFLWRAREAGRSVLVLDPMSGNWPAWADAGADLTVLDVGRGLGGPSAGLVAGRAAAIDRCRELLDDMGAVFAVEPDTVNAVAEAVAAWQPRPDPRVEAVSWRPPPVL
jgi:L-seryl-tRNA(Ser) seleniumtransferase